MPHLRLSWQYLRGENDISTQPLYAEDDADEARAWDGDFCQLSVMRDGYHPARWRMDSSDARLPDHADRLLFDSPTAALDHMAEAHGFTYEITDDQ